MNKYIDALTIAIENAKRNNPAYELNEVLRPIGKGFRDYANHIRAHDIEYSTKLALNLTVADTIVDEVCSDWFYPSIEKFSFIDNGISEEHEQYNTIWNQMRRSRYKHSIELKLLNKYILDIGITRTEMHLIRIQEEDHIYPTLYFSKDKDAKIGTNIGILKIHNNIKEEDA